MVLGLQDEIRRSEESRYDHRLHGVLLVAQGMTCPEAGKLLGDAPRTVQYWVHEFEEMGLAGLLEGERSGRPRRLGEKQLQEINAVLRHMPREAGLGGNLWDGKTLAAWIEREYGIDLGVRQCQRLFRPLGFRLRKPRPAIAQGRAIAGRQVRLLSRDRPIQRGDFPGVQAYAAAGKRNQRPPRRGHQRQCPISPCPAPQRLERATRGRLCLGLPAALQP